MWRARAHERRTSAARAGNARLRTFARHWELNDRGHPADDAWSSDAVSHFTAKIAYKLRARPRDDNGDQPACDDRTHDADRVADNREILIPIDAKRNKTPVKEAETERAQGGDVPNSMPHARGNREPSGATEDRETEAVSCQRQVLMGEPPLPTLTREFKRARLNQFGDEDVVIMHAVNSPPNPAAENAASSSSSSSFHAQPVKKRPPDTVPEPTGTDEPKRIRISDTSGEGVVHAPHRSACFSCWAHIATRGTCTMLRGARWRGVRAGEPLCATCNNFFISGRK